MGVLEVSEACETRSKTILRPESGLFKFIALLLEHQNGSLNAISEVTSSRGQ